MPNKKSACIFDHHGFVYTLDFKGMTCWILEESDVDDPITALDVRRLDNGEWLYRPISSDESPFLPFRDDELTRRVEKHYEQFVNQMIVGNNGRLQAHRVKAQQT